MMAPRRTGRLAALVLGAGLLAACATPPASCDLAAGAPDVAGDRLGAGDRIRVTVYRHTNLSGQLQLDGRGYVAMPLVGQIAADRLTTRALEDRIETRLREEDYLVDPQVSIEVLTHRPFYILGEVRRPRPVRVRERHERDQGRRARRRLHRSGPDRHRPGQARGLRFHR
jgi:polysaccharide export outer membrane protein